MQMNKSIIENSDVEDRKRYIAATISIIVFVHLYKHAFNPHGD